MDNEVVHGEKEIQRKRIPPNVTKRKKKVREMSLSRDVTDGKPYLKSLSFFLFNIHAVSGK